MKTLIAYCGLDCEVCEARLATLRDDEALRQKVAREWSALNGVEIAPEMIRCGGCRVDGPKTPYCEALCLIRRCALERGVATCGSCGEAGTCEKLGAILGNSPDAAWNLRGYAVIEMRERPELLSRAAAWFHEKWGVPEAVYMESISACLSGASDYGWYLCLDGDAIIGGLGIIDNDFHDRPDLSPNVCAVYTEEAFRGQGVAGRLLDRAMSDMRAKGIAPLYLATDITGFYERYGWEYLCMVRETGGMGQTRLYIHR